LSYKIEDIKELGREFGKINGVEAVVLFGSYARGDFDEGSDVDLLLIFQDKFSLEGGWRKITETTAKRHVFVQVVAMTADELRLSPLLSVVLREGKTLFSTEGFSLQGLANFKPYALVSYDLKSMTPDNKVKFVQTLQGRKSGKYAYKGILLELGGFKVGRNCLLLPQESVAKLTDFFDKEGVTYFIRHVWCL